MDRGDAVSNSDKVVVARLGGECVTAGELVDWLRVTERRSVVRDLLADRLVRRQALRAGWEPSPEELQAAVDTLRRRYKLYKAAEMHQWLADRGLSVEDLEQQMELQLWRHRIRNEVAGIEAVEREFIENRRQYDRVRLSRIVVAEAGVADEIRLQLDEGGDFGVLAQRYSTEVVSRDVGAIWESYRGPPCRRLLSRPCFRPGRERSWGRWPRPRGTSCCESSSCCRGN